MKDKDVNYLVSQLNAIISRYETMFADVKQARDTINEYVERINIWLGHDVDVEEEEGIGNPHSKVFIGSKFGVKGCQDV